MDPSGHAVESEGADDPGYYWFWFYYTNPVAYFEDYFNAQYNEQSESLTFAWQYQEEEFMSNRLLDDRIVPLMRACYEAEARRDPDEVSWFSTMEVRAITSGFVAPYYDPATMMYLQNTVKVWGSIMYEVGNTHVIEMPELGTGRTQPTSLREQLAMEQVQSDPLGGNAKRLDSISMGDSRWPGEQGWEKWQSVVETSYGKVVIHFNYNPLTSEFADFKFKYP